MLEAFYICQILCLKLFTVLVMHNGWLAYSLFHKYVLSVGFLSFLHRLQLEVNMLMQSNITSCIITVLFL